MKIRHKLFLVLLLCLLVHVQSEFVFKRYSSSSQQSCVNGKCHKSKRVANLECLNGECSEDDIFNENDKIIKKHRDFKMDSVEELLTGGDSFSEDSDFVDDIITLAGILDDEPQALYWYGNVYNDI